MAKNVVKIKKIKNVIIKKNVQNMSRTTASHVGKNIYLPDKFDKYT